MALYLRPRIGWFGHEKDLAALAHDCCGSCLISEKPDVVLGIESHFLNTVLTADSCSMDFDLGRQLALNRPRWSRLIKEYVDKAALQLFIEQARVIISGESRDGAVTEMRFKSPVRAEKKHRWGGCLLGITFHGNWKMGPTLTLYSRTTYMGYMGILDMAIIHLIAKQITSDSNGHLASKVKLIWHITSLQFHHFKTLPYIFSVPGWYDTLCSTNFNRDHHPVWWNVKRWFLGIQRDYKQFGVKMLEHEKYGPYKRVKRRWLEHIGVLKKNLPPSLKVTDLDFSKAE